MKYDTIQLSSSLVETSGTMGLVIDHNLVINWEKFHSEFHLDLASLVKSCQWSGELDIFTCGCGVAGCAGIFQGIEVRHTQDAITWRCPDPLSVDQSAPIQCVRAGSTYQSFSFEPDPYIDAIDHGVKTIKSLAIASQRPVEFPVHGICLEDVLALETRPFSTHIQEPGRRLTAKQVVIDAYHGHVFVGGVEYSMADLNLPDELMGRYRAWTSLCVFPNDTAGVPAYLVYLEAGRAFCRELRRHICRKTSVKLKYHPPPVWNSAAWEVIEIIR